MELLLCRMSSGLKTGQNEIYKFLSWHFASLYYALCALAVTVPHQAGDCACL